MRQPVLARDVTTARLAIKYGAAELYFVGHTKNTFKTPFPDDVKEKIRPGGQETDHFHARWPVFKGNQSPP